MKQIVIAAALAGLMSSVSMAQEKAPTTPEECLKSAFDIAQTAESKNLANGDLDKVEQMLNRMEGHCDAGQFVEAAAVATELKTIITKQ